MIAAVRINLVVIIVAVAAIATLATACITPPESPDSSPTAGDQQLSYDLSPHLAHADGTPTLLVFWAPWCPHCTKELPELQHLYQTELHQQGHEVIGIAVQTTAQKADEFREQHGLTFPIIHDRDGAIGQRYRIRAVPTYVFLDRDGEIAFRNDISDNTDMVTQIFALLEASQR